MYFYETIEHCDINKVVSNFLELCVNSPDLNRTEQCIRSTISELKNIEAIKSDSEILEIKRVSEEDEEFDDVHMIDTTDNTKYGLEINPWKYTLGYTVDERSLSDYGYEKFVSLLLWEMTWFGYDEETIQNHVKSWET